MGTIKNAGGSEDSMNQVSDHIASRVSVLQEAIQRRLREEAPPPNSNNGNGVEREITAELERLRAEAGSLQAQLAELTATRIYVVERERRTRRDVYRLASGLLTKEKFLARFETSPTEGENDDLDLQGMEQQVEEEARKLQKSSAEGHNAASGSCGDTAPIGEMSAISNAQFQTLQGKLQDALSQIKARDESIQEVCHQYFCFMDLGSASHDNPCK